MDLEKAIANFPVLTLWAFTIRPLGLIESERQKYCMYAALDTTSEYDAVVAIKKRFTPHWWDEHLIVEVTEIGKLHMFAGVPLYERD